MNAVAQSFFTNMHRKKGKKKTPQLSPNMNSKNNSGNSGMNTDEFWHMNYPNAFITVFLGTGE